MTDESLRAWLNGLGASTAPGLWTVKWVQGAVAGGAQQVNFTFRSNSAEAHIFGPVTAGARQLAEQFRSGRHPADPAHRPFVGALDGLESFPGTVRLSSRDGYQRQIVTLEQGTIKEVKHDEFEGASANLSLFLEAPGRASPLSSRWAAELRVLKERVKYCPLPVMIGRALISQQPVFSGQRRALMNWMEPAMGNERFFSMQGDPRQILAPRLVSGPRLLPSTQRCSLMVSLARAAPGEGAARVHWIRDGALTGPVRLLGPTGALDIEIFCPGDRPGLDLREWHKLDPGSLFPEALALGVARRRAAGLDSMGEAARQTDRPIDDLIRRGQGTRALQGRLPTLGRPYNALGGSFHDSLKAFSQRPRLELVLG